MVWNHFFIHDHVNFFFNFLIIIGGSFSSTHIISVYVWVCGIIRDNICICIYV